MRDVDHVLAHIRAAGGGGRVAGWRGAVNGGQQHGAAEGFNPAPKPSLDDDPGFLSGVEIAEPRKGLKPPVWRTLNELCGERGARLICREVQVNLAYRWFCKLGILTGRNLPKRVNLGCRSSTKRQ
jgi:hypothetical protein